MTNRLNKIKTGCLFVGNLILDGREKTNLFFRALGRLKQLIDAEISGEPGEEIMQVDLFEEAKEIFTPESSKDQLSLG